MRFRYRCFRDHATQNPFWMNLRTREIYWTKPMIMKHVDMGEPVALGPSEYHVDCAFCECADCENASARRPRVAADVACDVCHMVFCAECFERTHIYLPKHQARLSYVAD